MHALNLDTVTFLGKPILVSVLSEILSPLIEAPQELWTSYKQTFKKSSHFSQLNYF